MKIHTMINGRERDLEIYPDEFLLETLRKEGYYSVKEGCKMGACGSCTIWLDEQPVLACLTLSARADGHRITTLEGVQKEAETLGKYIVGEGVEQCGYCSPGLMMLALAMRRELKNPTKEEIREYIKGNLCRCSGYQGKVRAIEQWIEELSKEAAE